MRIFFDTQILAYVANGYKAGIARYCIELIRALQSYSPKIEMFTGVWKNSLYDCEATQVNRVRKIWPELFSRITNNYRSRFYLSPLYRAIGHLALRTRLKKSQKVVTVLDWLRKSIEKQDQIFLLDEYNVDVFHSPFYPLPVPQQTKNMARILTVHDVLALKYPEYHNLRQQRIVKAFVESIQPNSDWVICDSNTTKEDLLSIRPELSERTTVIPLAAPSNFQPYNNPGELSGKLARWGLEKDKYILSVATLEPRKNLIFLIECYKELLEEGSIQNRPLVVVGAPHAIETATKIYQLAESLRGHLIVLGYVEDETLRALYSGAGLFIYIPHCEGFGFPALEAMQCMAPVILSNCNSLIELTKGKGIHVDAHNRGSLKNAILHVLTNDSLKNDLKYLGLGIAHKYSWEKTAELTSQVYSLALHRN